MRSLRRARWMAALAVAGLLLGTVDLHALVHHRQNLGDEAPAAHHPDPVHLDAARASHELPCLACSAGLKNQGRLTRTARLLADVAACGHLPAGEATAGAGCLPYRLPLSRAPPLS